MSIKIVFPTIFGPVPPGTSLLLIPQSSVLRGAYNPAKHHCKIAQRRAAGPRTTRRNTTARLPSAGPEALRPHPPPRRAELIFKSLSLLWCSLDNRAFDPRYFCRPWSTCARSLLFKGSYGTSDFHTASRRSSVVEQLIRNQQVAGSNPIAGSTFNDLTILLGKHGVSSWINFTSRCPHQPCFLHRQREPLLLACLPLSLLPDSPCGTILPPTNSPYSTFWSNQ